MSRYEPWACLYILQIMSRESKETDKRRLTHVSLTEKRDPETERIDLMDLDMDEFVELLLSIEELGNNNTFPEGGSIQSGSILCLKPEEMRVFVEVYYEDLQEKDTETEDEWRKREDTYFATLSFLGLLLNT